MWSFGCIVAELYIGLPLFPGASEYDVLCRMIEILGLVHLIELFPPFSSLQPTIYSENNLYSITL